MAHTVATHRRVSLNFSFEVSRTESLHQCKPSCGADVRAVTCVTSKPLSEHRCAVATTPRVVWDVPLFDALNPCRRKSSPRPCYAAMVTGRRGLQRVKCGLACRFHKPPISVRKSFNSGHVGDRLRHGSECQQTWQGLRLKGPCQIFSGEPSLDRYPLADFERHQILPDLECTGVSLARFRNKLVD